MIDPGGIECKRRRLRKRKRTRGHGTLNYLDLIHAQRVDITGIDCANDSLTREFGRFGKLPYPYCLRQIKTDIPRGSLARYCNLRVEPGSYEVRVSLHGSFFNNIIEPLCHKSLSLKIWVLNRSVRYAKAAFDCKLDKKHNSCSFKFQISHQDCAKRPAELHIQYLSNQTLRRLTIDTSIYLLSPPSY